MALYDASKFDETAGDESDLGIDPIVQEAKRRWQRCSEWEGSCRERFIDDLRFENGDSDNGYQWPNAIRRAREVDARPVLTMNIIRQHNLQISNQMRKNKSSVKYIAQGNGATVESAQIMRQIARRIEQRSNAQYAYTLARNFQIGGGIGYWRISTDYINAKTFDQDINILPVLDPLSIYMDPDMKEKDGSDANFAFVFDNIPRGLFDEQYPEFKDMVGRSPLVVAAGDDDWVSKDYVRVCEYYRRVGVSDTLVSFVWQGERKTLLSSRMPKNIRDYVLRDPTVKTREVQVNQIEWYKIAGEYIIDSTLWIGSTIPIVRVIGEETVIDGILDRKGHTRWMKDAQRMFNYNAALDIDTPIPTSSGWTTMGQLRDGDWVFGADGKPVQVAKALPVKIGEPCYRVTFDNGHSVVTDAGHIWRVEERGKRKSWGFPWDSKTVSTVELESKKHFIKLAQPLELLETDLPVDPYVLGVWLGDGNSSSGLISAHEDDAEEQKKLINECGFATSETRRQSGKGVSFHVFGLRGLLAKAGVLNNKHVPEIYLRASYEQRLALLQGLFDTDGCFHNAVNQCIFVNTNPMIAESVLELCASLGIKAHCAKQKAKVSLFPDGHARVCQDNYRIYFTVDPDLVIFRLERKLEKQTKGRVVSWRRTKRLGIASVTPVESRPVRCIMLDTPDHLYLCGKGMIPTHNSSQVEFVALQGKTPWVADARAIEEHESMWNTANTANHSVLIYNGVDDEGQAIAPPTRTPPPTASPAYQNGMDVAFNQMMMVSGQWQNQMGMMGNERTGAAIQGRQQQSETAVYHFQDNYEDALIYTGKILLDLIPKVYDTKRVLRIQAEDEEDYEILIDPQAKQAYLETQAANGKAAMRIFNPSLGEYDIVPSVGPSMASKRQQTAEALTLILTQAPDLIPVIGDLLVSSLDFDKAQEAAQRLRRLVPPAALGRGPTPNEQQLMSANQSLQQALTESLQKQAKGELKLVGKEQMRDIDVYKAQTDRIKALADELPMDPQGLMELIQQLVDESLQSKLSPIIAANADDIDADGGKDVPEGHPGITGARKAPDGQWYVEHPMAPGKFMKIVPNTRGAA